MDAAMIFDLNNPSLPNLKALLADQHERLNFPDLWHRTCIDVATNLLARRLIDHPDCVEYCELADAGLDDAVEARTTWPRGWDIHLNYTLTSPETGETWATCSGCSFIRPEMGLYPVGQFTRRDEGRIYLVDMFQRETFGVFVTPTTADIGGLPYEMVLAGRWDGQKVVPIEEPGRPS